MKYLSVCAGIEAASVAWHPLGWKPLAFSEIEPFPRAVLAHHYPGVPLHGDFTKLRDDPWIADADVLVGGTPCQAFSVAGLRNSLADDRGNLSLEYVRLADAIDASRHAAGKQPAIIVWENVPGVLSVKDNAFGCFLSALAGEDTPIIPTGGRWTDAGVVDGPRRRIAWRILDAQYFGLAQRRRRVFVVASARDGFDPAAVLFEQNCLRWNPPTRGETGEVAPTIPSRSTGGGGLGTDFDLDGGVIRQPWSAEIAPTLNAHFGEKQGLEDQHIGGGQGYSFPAISQCLNAGGMGRRDAETETLIPTIGGVFDVAHTLKADGFDASEDGTGRGTPLVPVAYSIMPQNSGRDYKAREVEVAQPIMAGGPVGGNQGGDYIMQPVAFSYKDNGADAANDLSPTLRALGGYDANGGGQMAVTYPINTQIALRHQALGERTGLGIGSEADPGFTLQAGHSHAVAVALRGRDGGSTAELGGDIQNALRSSSGGGDKPHVLAQMAVRRLTPRECEALQGFPADYTAIPWRGKPAADCPDGPRYKSLGNSMAVPVIRWIGNRIAQHLKEVE